MMCVWSIKGPPDAYHRAPADDVRFAVLVTVIGCSPTYQSKLCTRCSITLKLAEPAGPKLLMNLTWRYLHVFCKNINIGIWST